MMDPIEKQRKDLINELKQTCPHRKMRIIGRGMSVPENKSCKYPKYRGRTECVIFDHPLGCPVVKEQVDNQF